MFNKIANQRKHLIQEEQEKHIDLSVPTTVLNYSNENSGERTTRNNNRQKKQVSYNDTVETTGSARTNGSVRTTGSARTTGSVRTNGPYSSKQQPRQPQTNNGQTNTRQQHQSKQQWVVKDKHVTVEQLIKRKIDTSQKNDLPHQLLEKGCTNEGDDLRRYLEFVFIRFIDNEEKYLRQQEKKNNNKFKESDKLLFNRRTGKYFYYFTRQQGTNKVQLKKFSYVELFYICRTFLGDQSLVDVYNQRQEKRQQKYKNQEQVQLLESDYVTRLQQQLDSLQNSQNWTQEQRTTFKDLKQMQLQLSRIFVQQFFSKNNNEKVQAHYDNFDKLLEQLSNDSFDTSYLQKSDENLITKFKNNVVSNTYSYQKNNVKVTVVNSLYNLYNKESKRLLKYYSKNLFNNNLVLFSLRQQTNN